MLTQLKNLNSIIFGQDSYSETIGYCSFYNCQSLTSVIIPNGVLSIDSFAFERCSNLTSITISNSVTNVGKDVFYGTSYYQNINNWDNNVLYINNYLI